MNECPVRRTRNPAISARVRVPFSRVAGIVLGRPEFKFAVTPV